MAGATAPGVGFGGAKKCFGEIFQSEQQIGDSQSEGFYGAGFVSNLAFAPFVNFFSLPQLQGCLRSDWRGTSILEKHKSP